MNAGKTQETVVTAFCHNLTENHRKQHTLLQYSTAHSESASSAHHKLRRDLWAEFPRCHLIIMHGKSSS